MRTYLPEHRVSGIVINPAIDAPRAGGSLALNDLGQGNDAGSARGRAARNTRADRAQDAEPGRSHARLRGAALDPRHDRRRAAAKPDVAQKLHPSATGYIDKPYYLGPEKGGDRAYRLLAKAMRETGLSALARYAARGKQYLVRLTPVKNGIVLEQLHYAHEVRSMDRELAVFPAA
ncbi:MAG: Ku protein [Longimicrobiales bacterium]